MSQIATIDKRIHYRKVVQVAIKIKRLTMVQIRLKMAHANSHFPTNTGAGKQMSLEANERAAQVERRANERRTKLKRPH